MPGPEPAARGVVVFFTGLSGAGKSTIARPLAAALRQAHPRQDVALLDGDEIRRHLSADLGFDAASRAANVERVARLAADMAAGGAIVVTALIAPFEAGRQVARSIVAPRAPFLLVWVRTPIDLAEARDVKGLYARARAGEIPDFTGVSAPYEPPADAELVIDTSTTAVDVAVARIAAAVEAALTSSG
jgi:sulfate adenylyltransferase